MNSKEQRQTTATLGLALAYGSKLTPAQQELLHAAQHARILWS